LSTYSQKELTQSQEILSNYLKIDKIQGTTVEETLGIVEDNALIQYSELAPLAVSLSTLEDKNKFSDYLARNFVKEVAVREDLTKAVGHLYLKETSGKFHKVSLNPFVISKVKGTPKKAERVYYNSKITDKKSIDLAIAFLKLDLSNEKTAELLIKDEITFIMDDEIINKNALKLFVDDAGEKAKNYYFSYAATLTSMTYKTYAKTGRIKPSITASWMTVNGEKYKEETNMNYKPDVHVDLIRLDQMVFGPNIMTIPENNPSNKVKGKINN